MMKNNKTESEIFDQIRESLGHFEEAYIPGSWENFLQKRKKNRRIIFLRIASGIAACLLVGFLGLNYFQSEKRVRSVLTTEQFTKSIVEKPGNEENIVEKTLPSTMVASSNFKQSGYTGVKTSGYAGRKKNLTAEGLEKPASHPLASSFVAEPKDTVTTLSAYSKPQPAINKVDTTRSSSDTLKGKTENSFQITPQTKDNESLATVSKRKVRFGINFSPGVSSTESSGSLNYMGGISADFSLSSKVALSTGLQFENQSFVKKMPGIVSSSAVPLNETRTTLTNLDLPVNITWKFAALKTHAYYVSGGLSSLVYLSQEDKNTTYSQDLIPASSMFNGEEVKSYSIVNHVSVTQDAVSPSQTFDFAGRINLMIGFEKQLSNRIYFHVEPYTKFPTSVQATGSLNHTISGINFKISF